MKSHSLKSDLEVLELGREHFPRFSKDTTDAEVKRVLGELKEMVRQQRDRLVEKYGSMAGGNEEKIKEIDEAANRIFDL